MYLLVQLSPFSLQGDADPNGYYGGFSPLLYAAREGDTKYLKRLLQAGADPNADVNIYFCLC